MKFFRRIFLIGAKGVFYCLKHIHEDATLSYIQTAKTQLSLYICAQSGIALDKRVI